MDFGAALVCLALIATLPMSLSNPTPLLSEDDEEVLLSESVAVVDYQDPPPHYRPVREHDPANDFDSALSARAGPPPLMSLSGKRNDLLATMYLSVDRDHDCQPMSRKAARMCAQFGYNMTRVPNLLNHQTQVEAYQQLVGYKELLRSNCAQDLLFLLCSYHLPSCQGTRKQIMTETTSVGDVALVTPCRGLCERVRDSCLPLLQRYGYDWPWSMQCDRLQTEPLMTEPQSRQLVACVNTPPPKQAGDSTAPEEAVTEQPAPEQETRKCITVSSAHTSVAVVIGYQYMYIHVLQWVCNRSTLWTALWTKCMCGGHVGFRHCGWNALIPIIVLAWTGFQGMDMYRLLSTEPRLPCWLSGSTFLRPTNTTSIPFA